jgi:hypothetical protein
MEKTLYGLIADTLLHVQKGGLELRPRSQMQR